ncbi:MAG TPA: hypothetical protein VND95_11115 [Stellaceae bacterium]|nr:hypothetical protein [Stellaceae bacterium]
MSATTTKLLHRAALGVLAVCLGSAAMTAAPAAAREHRSHRVLLAFQREHPCPSTGRTRGRCPGYWKDHIRPLACGGPDAVANLQWQTIAAAKAKDKDKWERNPC